MSSGSLVDGETYLEGFIESLSTLPAELRRNLDLMKDMDGSCSTLMDETMRLQLDYIRRVEDKIGRLEVVDGEGVRVLSNNDDIRKLPVVIPTTEELMAYVHEPTTLSQIESLRADSLQQAEEKVEIAKQTYKMIDNLYQKLDADLRQREMELSLSTRNGPDFHHHHPSNATATMNQGAPKLNDLAAIQVPGTSDWILAKVVTHDPKTGMFTLSDEDVESNKVFNLPASSVIILERMRNIRSGDVVFAVYPDTTSFYQGTIAQQPRKAAGGGMFVTITFLDDEDAATGETHDKAVLLKHVMSPPY
ncbi:hypothetical protein FRACYDRAFT_188007 [Fragilariopsis cylindrus CCMP1102]|uniref:SGF29 C-terminal domain-containing protein n=1 Tax=Fragilariopsis cylindrus CCMP1102 TaxID=635003 RepID=A0A1E7F949_9STRA|nr:hypothetical protein FRACYDRAFT_188007 [Fragilariopsis cylindrus CCMP1102]|eukprot:OEU14692.1 hypothetical protein FRACYDRAFT_188007 [Fragilariopsis cylindrus CCMP1102]